MKLIRLTGRHSLIKMADILASVKSSVTSVYHTVTLYRERSCSVQCNISKIITFILRPPSSNM